MRIGFTLSLVLLFGIATSTQAQAPPRRPAQAGAHHTSTAALDAATQYKGILEPVNYGQDINLTDVFFVSPDVGWVSGEHATLLKTTDGGANWKAQVGGDPSGNEKPIGQLRFLDSRHGWAVTGDSPQRLLRTMDGENWEQIGQQPGAEFIDYAFTSVRHGIALGANMGGFYVTNDGGRHWQNVAPCQVHATVQGLARTEDCRVRKLQMLSSRSGYATADWSGGTAFLRTDDAGGHWTSIANNLSDCCGPDFFFIDLEHGVLLFNNGKTYLTSDGARTWHALLSGSVGLSSGGHTPPLIFADPQVGWVIGSSPDNSDTFRVSYSTDSGQHWRMSHNITFPIGPRYAELKFNFARRDSAYVIGPHGMIFRYRVVPANYSAANALDAPAMPGFGMAELSVKADAIRRDIESLRAKLVALPGGSPTSAASTTAASTTAEQPAGTSTASPADTCASGQPSGVSSGQSPASSDAAASGGFTPQTDVSATADALASGDLTSASPAFTQDTSPPSDVLATCCAAAVQQLQTDTSGFVTQIAPVTSQLRPLNLIIAGLQLAATLTNQGHGLWNQFKALKHAPSAQAAAQALQQLSSTLTTVQQASSSGLQNPGTWFAANAPATFTQDVSATVAPQSGATSQSSTPQPSTQTQSSGTNQQQNPAQNSVDKTLDSAKQKLKNKLNWPKL
ncbi:MAG: WD40/YVTN/BNR-like repeat-containing protein [Terriglobales bacterium]